MFEVILVLVGGVLTLSYGLPIMGIHESDDSVLSPMNLANMANIMVSTSFKHPSDEGLETTAGVHSNGIHSSHLIEASKDLAKGAVTLPLETMAEAGAAGGAITAAAGLGGVVKGTAIATPIILKAVALPGLAAGATAGVMAVPKLVSDFRELPQLLFHNVKSSVEDSANNFANLVILENAAETPETENHSSIDISSPSLDLDSHVHKLEQTVETLKAGALGLAAKGVINVKKGAYVAGRVILKPIAILTGIHLKMFGSGLAFGGKLIGGTGAGIAKAGALVKYTGLGGIGLGASAISWGLDKSTIDTHFRESQKFN